MINPVWDRRGVSQSFNPNRVNTSFEDVVSTPSDFELEPADNLAYGMRDYKRKGSMGAGSNLLVLNFPSTFQVGDHVIVEIGGEVGQGLRGTDGVGGTRTASDPGNLGNYYNSANMPLSYIGQIVSVNADGTELTMDTPSAVATTNATVYFDNFFILNTLLNTAQSPGYTVTFPAGFFAMATSVFPSSGINSGWVFQGAGKGRTVFYTPRGRGGGGFRMLDSPNMVLKDFSFIGNAGLDGFDQGFFGFGLLLTQCNNAKVSNISCHNVFAKAVWIENSDVGQIDDCECYMEHPQTSYLAQWFFGASDSSLVTVNNCIVDSAYLGPGFEMFRSDGVIFNECHGRNATFSNNSSGNFQFNNCSLTVNPLTQFTLTANLDLYYHHLSPGVNINTNIQPPDPSVANGGTITNFIGRSEGFIDNVDLELHTGININADNPNVTVSGGSWTFTSNQQAGTDNPPRGVNSTGVNTTVQNFTVFGGTPQPGFFNISVTDGAVTNCTAQAISCVGPGCILT